MSKGSTFVAFIFGAGIGSAATWFYVKKKYERLAQDEIEEVKDIYKRKNSFIEKEAVVTDNFTAEEIAMVAKEKPNILDYATKVHDNGYRDYSTKINESPKKKLEDEEPEENEVKETNGPYVITPDAFGEYVGYDTITLRYYDDDILTEEDGEVVDDVEEMVGQESLATFGQYEDDAVYVRNDEHKCDYEILLVTEKYYNYPDSEE